jgi:sucrose-6-phosphate hydrolase SacC (GH32 family)
MPFNQCMLFPVELTLHATEEGIRMFAEPVREIRTLYKKKHAWQGKTIKPGENLLQQIKGELFHIQAEFSLADAEEFGFVIRGLPVTYNAREYLIACKDKKAPLKPADGKIGLEILVDRNSVEIFGNNGSMYMPIGQVLPEDNKSIELFTKGGKTQVEDLEVYELNSVWK